MVTLLGEGGTTERVKKNHGPLCLIENNYHGKLWNNLHWNIVPHFGCLCYQRVNSPKVFLVSCLIFAYMPTEDLSLAGKIHEHKNSLLLGEWMNHQTIKMQTYMEIELTKFVSQDLVFLFILLVGDTCSLLPQLLVKTLPYFFVMLCKNKLVSQIWVHVTSKIFKFESVRGQTKQ